MSQPAGPRLGLAHALPSLYSRTSSSQATAVPSHARPAISLSSGQLGSLHSSSRRATHVINVRMFMQSALTYCCHAAHTQTRKGCTRTAATHPKPLCGDRARPPAHGHPPSPALFLTQTAHREPTRPPPRRVTTSRKKPPPRPPAAANATTSLMRHWLFRT